MKIIIIVLKKIFNLKRTVSNDYYSNYYKNKIKSKDGST